MTDRIHCVPGGLQDSVERGTGWAGAQRREASVFALYGCHVGSDKYLWLEISRPSSGARGPLAKHDWQEMGTSSSYFRRTYSGPDDLESSCKRCPVRENETHGTKGICQGMHSEFPGIFVHCYIHGFLIDLHFVRRVQDL